MNGLAHKFAARDAGRWTTLAFILETVLVVLPIISVGITTSVLTAPPTNQVVQRFNSRADIVLVLGMLAITSNSLALLVSMSRSRFQWGQRQLVHQNIMASYDLVAQKARRLDKISLPLDEAEFLSRSLEESFELHKSTGLEPSDRQFERAYAVVRKMDPYPFGIKADDFRKPRRRTLVFTRIDRETP